MEQSRKGGQRRAWLLPCLLLLVSLLDHVSCQQSMLNGYYIPTTNVESELNFALDIAEMREVQDGSGRDDEGKQRDIYINGMHSKIKGPDGTDTLRSLASLSLNAEQVMAGDFMYTLYRKAFFDLGVLAEEETPGNFDGKPASQYANTIVNDLFALQSPGIETEAALALNVWMAVAHELWEYLRACHRNNANSTQEMNVAVDRAAALWIGQDQDRGDAERGQLLYNLAEKAGKRFNQNNGNNEVVANSVIVESLKQLQQEIQNGTCERGMEGLKEVRGIVQTVWGYMSVPLVQQLIHHIRQIGNGVVERGFIELYTLSIIPQVAYCDPTAHEKLVGFFVTETIDQSTRDDAISVLQSAYSCMRVTCEMVGSYMEGEVEECKDVPDTPRAYAGYQPTHNAIEYAYIDRDIAQFRVLMEEGAYHAALDLYHHGRNSRPGSEFLTLHFLATFEGRNIVPNVQIFSDYFDVEGEDGFLYADNIITNVVNRQGLYEDLSPQILTEIGVGALQYMVMYVAVLHKLDVAVDRCKTNETADAIESWDQAAALFVGSVEGEDANGSAQGYGELLFGAGKFFCQLFNTCISGTAKMNQDIMAAFDVGRVNIQDGECESAIQDVIFMEQDLLVPLVQGTLHYAVLNAPLPANANDAILGTGHILAQSIIPLVDDIDEPSGSTIDDNTNVFGRRGPIDSTAVVNAFKTAVAKGLEVDCDVMGAYTALPDPDGNVCKSDLATPGAPGTQGPTKEPAEQTQKPVPLVNIDDETLLPYQMCEGNCEGSDVLCGDGLSCFSRKKKEKVPGCKRRGIKGNSYCYVPPPGVLVFTSISKDILGKCQGQCKDDSTCEEGLKCFLRKDQEPVPGCDGLGIPKVGYCYDPNTVAPTTSPQPSTTTEAPSATMEETTSPQPTAITKESESLQPTATQEPIESSQELKIVNKEENITLGLCEGNCFEDDSKCEEGLSCFARMAQEDVPGCQGSGTKAVSYCYNAGTPSPLAATTAAPSATSQPEGSTQWPTSAPTTSPPTFLNGTVTPTVTPVLNTVDDPPMLSLGMCQGTCGGDDLLCGVGLSCFTRLALEDVPGCSGSGAAGENYCYKPPPGVLVYVADDFTENFPLENCQGDCDRDSDCTEGLFCYLREGVEPVPGCKGKGVAGRDYCHDPDEAGPTPESPATSAPTSSAKELASRQGLFVAFPFIVILGFI